MTFLAAPPTCAPTDPRCRRAGTPGVASSAASRSRSAGIRGGEHRGGGQPGGDLVGEIRPGQEAPPAGRDAARRRSPAASAACPPRCPWRRPPAAPRRPAGAPRQPADAASARTSRIASASPGTASATTMLAGSATPGRRGLTRRARHLGGARRIARNKVTALPGAGRLQCQRGAPGARAEDRDAISSAIRSSAVPSPGSRRRAGRAGRPGSARPRPRTARAG